MPSLPTSVTTLPSAQEELQEASFSWSIHLLRRHPGCLLRIVTILSGVFVVSLCLFHSFWLALLPVAAVLFSLSEFIFPIHYSLTKQGASARYGLTSLEISWKDVRHAYLTDEGVKLSPLRVRNSRLEPLRGIFLRLDDTNQEAVISAVRRARQEWMDRE